MTTMSLSSRPFVFGEQEKLLHIERFQLREGGRWSPQREARVGHLILSPEVVPGHEVS